MSKKDQGQRVENPPFVAEKDDVEKATTALGDIVQRAIKAKANLAGLVPPSYIQVDDETRERTLAKIEWLKQEAEKQKPSK